MRPNALTHPLLNSGKFCCCVHALAKKKMDLTRVCKENSLSLQWFLLARELPPNDFCSRGCMQREVPSSTMTSDGEDVCKENSHSLWWFLISACQRTPTLYNDFCLPGHHTTYNNQPIHPSSLPFFSLFRDNPSIRQPFAHPPSTIAPSLMSNTNADSNDATGIPPPVWLPTPRPMTDEELAMPMTTAPTNKGASEMGPLDSSDSGTAPPSSKKAHTTSLSTTIKNLSWSQATTKLTWGWLMQRLRGQPLMKK